ncbi:MAG: SagB/ThcOx family dehydrogenase [Acidimicrobiia bacterium]
MQPADAAAPRPPVSPVPDAPDAPAPVAWPRLVPELVEQLATLGPDDQRTLATVLARSRHRQRDTGLDPVFLSHDQMRFDPTRPMPNPTRADQHEILGPSRPGPVVPLAHPRPGERSVWDALDRRATVRDHDDRPVPRGGLVPLICYAVGRRRTTATYGIHDLPLRTVMSAGGIESVEILVAARAVDGLARGVHRYDVRAHALVSLPIAEPAMLLMRACGQQAWVLEAPVVLLLLGRLARSRWKYGDMAYRLLQQDVGNVQANVALVASAMGWSACPYSGFDPDELGADLGLRPGAEFVAGTIVLGLHRAAP